MLQIVLLIHIIISVALVALILLQQGKGADVGAAFGSGASQTVFGSQGSASFLTKVTASLAALFFVTSISLGFLYAHQKNTNSVLPLPTSQKTQLAAPQKQTTAPATTTSSEPASTEKKQ